MGCVRRAALTAFCGALWTTQAAAAAGQCAQPIPDDAPALSDDRDAGLRLSADSAELQRDGLSLLSGEVLLRDEKRAFSSQALRFDSSQRLVDIPGPSSFRSESLYIRSGSARFDLDGESGQFDDSQVILPQSRVRGAARHLYLDSTGQAVLDGARYTSCAPDQRAWELRASRITLDEVEGLGSARHARLHLAGVPVLYLPYIQFPIDDRRRTGILFPSGGSSTRNGADVTWPVYFNLAPNYDLTISPRYMSKRGLQWGGEFRYLLAHHHGEVRYAYLPEDDRIDDDRAFGGIEHESRFGDRLSMHIDYSEVSDQQYFDDFGADVDASALNFLPRELGFVYNQPGAFNLSVLASRFQVLDPSLAVTEKPLDRLPQVRFDAVTPGALFFTRAGLNAEYTFFDGDRITDGHRIHANPFLRTSVDRSSWFAAGRLDWRYTAYRLREQAPGLDDTPDRSLPSLSLDGGLRFERLTKGGNVQTLEPRGFYLFTPQRNQDDIPLFDSGDPDFDVIQLFSTNRFTGIDRIADANQLAGAITSRLLDSATGEVRWTATIGQLLRFESSEVVLRDSDRAASSGVSDFIAALDYRLSRRLNADISTLFSTDDGEFNRVLSRLVYRDGGRQLLAAYRFRRSLLEQADLSATWPLFGGVSVLGRWRFSLRDSQTQESVAGLSFDSCCWTARLVYRRHLATTAGDFDSGVFLQFELKGLGGFGGRSVPGMPDELETP